LICILKIFFLPVLVTGPLYCLVLSMIVSVPIEGQKEYFLLVSIISVLSSPWAEQRLVEQQLSVIVFAILAELILECVMVSDVSVTIGWCEYSP